METCKQIIVVRKDLNMPPGKLAAQVAHASLSVILKCGNLHVVTDEKGQPWHRNMVIPLLHKPALDAWLNEQSFTKVVLAADSEEEMMSLYTTIEQTGLTVSLITDNGTTVFNGVPTKTCFAVEPIISSAIDKYTGHLRLY